LITAGAHYLGSSSNLFCVLKLLNTTDLYSLQLAAFMNRHQNHNHNLPIAFNNYFLYTAIVHSHSTRGRPNLYRPSRYHFMSNKC